jgi:uncharacterized phage infection (PIP) family protein YhgE
MTSRLGHFGKKDKKRFSKEPIMSTRKFLTLLLTFSLVLASAGLAQQSGSTRPKKTWKDREDKLDQGLKKYRDFLKTFTCFELEDEINLLNLLNGLYLTDRQMLRLIVIGNEANRLRANYHQQVEKINQQLASDLERLQRALLAGRKDGVSALARRCEKAQQRLRELAAQLKRKAAQLEQQVRQVLTSSQITIVENFVHCFIPPKDIQDPTRIGQANENEGRWAKFLDRMREASEEELPRIKQKFYQRFFDYMKCHHITVTGRQAEAVKQYLEAIIQKVRSMDDIEYQLSRGDLSRRMEDVQAIRKVIKYAGLSDKEKQRAERKRKLKQREQEREAKRVPQLTKIGRLLLHPRLPQILTERMRASKSFVPPPQADVDQLESPGAT